MYHTYNVFFLFLKSAQPIFFNVVVVKEREIEIGYPTDVKHVAHIGWDGPSGSGPSWVRRSLYEYDFFASVHFF